MTALLVTWMLLFGQTASDADILKTFYLREGTSSQRLSEILRTLRQGLNLKYMIMNTSVTGITVRDTPERVAQAENLLAQSGLRDSSAAVAINSDKEHPDESHIVQTFYLGDSSTQVSLVEIVTALRTVLNIRLVASNKNAKAIAIRDTRGQVALAGKLIADLDRSPSGAGLQVSAIIDAGKASELGRRDPGGTEREISLRNVQTEEGAKDIVVALRTLLNNPQIEAGGSMIVLRDTESNLLIAERIVADLDKPGKR
jgi:hypothetical protein